MTAAERRARNREHMRRVRAQGGRRCPTCGGLLPRLVRVHPECRRAPLGAPQFGPVELAQYHQYQGA